MSQPPQPPASPDPASGADPYAGLPPAPPAPPPGYAQPYQQPVAPGMHVDPQSGLPLPDGVELASVGRRIGAWFLAIPLAVVTLGIGYVIWGLIVWGKGQTPALQVLGMRCWRPDTQTVPGFWRMALREIVGRLVEGIVSLITELVSFILFLTRNDRQSLHDLIAATVVVYDPQKVLDR
jgi:uncharacterized RDD family membrane protein YckC